jgi:hypothetical protein
MSIDGTQGRTLSRYSNSSYRRRPLEVDLLDLAR